MNWEYILIFFNGYLMIRGIMRFTDMMSGYIELKKMPYLLNGGIRVGNILYDKKRYVCQICINVIGVILCLSCILYLKSLLSYPNLGEANRALFLRYILALIFALASCLIETVISVFRSLYGKKCYLTKDGMLTIEGIYRKGKCRFAVETELSEAGNGNKYIAVYKQRAVYPYRYKVIEQEDAVIKMIDGMKQSGA